MADEFFGGFGNSNPRPEAPMFSPITPTEPEPQMEDTVEAPVAEAPVEEATANPDEETSKSKRPRRSGGRPRSSSRKPKTVEGITEETVAVVRKYIEKAESADDKTKNVVRFLLGIKKGNDDALIAALADGDSASKVAKAIDKEIDLLDYNDIKAGAVLGGEEKSERKYHWNLAAAVDPEAATVISPNGSMPTSRDVVDEAIAVRELQKGIEGYRDVLTAVKTFIVD